MVSLFVHGTPGGRALHHRTDASDCPWTKCGCRAPRVMPRVSLVVVMEVVVAGRQVSHGGLSSILSPSLADDHHVEMSTPMPFLGPCGRSYRTPRCSAPSRRPSARGAVVSLHP